MNPSPDPIDVALGARLRLRRAELKISQGVLGEALDLTFQQIQKYETGANRISASKLVKAAEALHCSVGFLLGDGETGDAFPLAKHLPPDALQLIEAFAKIERKRDRKVVLALARMFGEQTDRE